jgi:hypothetical protein
MNAVSKISSIVDFAVRVVNEIKPVDDELSRQHVEKNIDRFLFRRQYVSKDGEDKHPVFTAALANPKTDSTHWDGLLESIDERMILLEAYSDASNFLEPLYSKERIVELSEKYGFDHHAIFVNREDFSDDNDRFTELDERFFYSDGMYDLYSDILDGLLVSILTDSYNKNFVKFMSTFAKLAGSLNTTQDWYDRPIYDLRTMLYHDESITAAIRAPFVLAAIFRSCLSPDDKIQLYLAFDEYYSYNSYEYIPVSRVYILELLADTVESCREFRYLVTLIHEAGGTWMRSSAVERVYKKLVERMGARFSPVVDRALSTTGIPDELIAKIAVYALN